MGQGQPRVIIWTTLVVLPYTMLHTKFQGHWSIGSGEEDFLRFLPYMGMAAMLVMWPRSFEQLFFPKGPGGCIWNLVAIGPVVSEEKSFEIVDGRRTDGRRTTDNGACLYYKLPRSLRLRWAKKGVCYRKWHCYSQTVSKHIPHPHQKAEASAVLLQLPSGILMLVIVYDSPEHEYWPIRSWDPFPMWQMPVPWPLRASVWHL